MSKNSKDPRIAIIFTMIVIAIFLIYRYFSQPDVIVFPPQDIKVVEIEKAELKDIIQTTDLIGTVKANNSSTLIAQENGILNIVLSSGSMTNKGNIIAKIENNEIERNYNLLSDAEAIARAQFERAKVLLKSDTYSQSQFEVIKNSWILAQKDLADAKINLDKLKFYSPFNGIVGHYKIKSGQYIQKGEKIVTIYDPSSIRVDFDIPAPIISNINTNQKLLINEQEYQLTSVQKILDDEKHMIPASVNINCKDCIIGANVDVKLFLTKRKQVIVIPFEAVFLKEGKPSVYIVENNKTILKNIELGLREKQSIEIISGLKAGEDIVIRGTNRLNPELEVKIHPSNTRETK